MASLRIRIAAVVIALTAVFAIRSAGALDGEALYHRHCARCHGADGHGGGPDAALFVTPPRDLRSGFLAQYSTDDLVRRIRTGAPLTLALDLPALRAHANDVEALAAHLERLPKIDWRRVEEGQAVYVDRCELCHGPLGVPGPTAPAGARSPRDLSDPVWQKATGDPELMTVIRHGRHGMPPLDPPLPESDATALLAFVRVLSPGYTLYDRYCAACHGDDGRGAGSFADDAKRPTVVFDRSYFARRDPERVRAAVWHMLATARPAMPHLRGKIIESEARAIVTYLRRDQ